MIILILNENQLLFIVFSFQVIVCTENRLLVWNLLTLRLQTALKLSARHIVIDPLTNLIAIFTTRNNCKIQQKIELKIK